MSVYYTDDQVTVHRGDCLDVLPTLHDCSVDAVVTDPPYDLTASKKGGSGVASVNPDNPYGRSRIGTGNGGGGFMGKSWDATGVAFDPETWRRVYRVLKPGGHLLAFGGTRTSHRLTCAIEDAGFEIRDSIAWMYATGFPKSLNPYRSIMGACQNSGDAPHAVRISRFIPVPSSAAKEPTALALARIQPGDAPVLLTETGGAAGSNVRTATLLSALAERMNLSTDLLWSVLWAANSDPANMCTTLTTSRTTTVSAILSSLPSKITPANTTRDHNLPPGCSCAAFAAGPGFSAISSGSNVIPVLTAPESASGGPLEPLDKLGTSTKPAYEPITVARKPLVSTVAANILQYGTGALNIDGCRLSALTPKEVARSGKSTNGAVYGEYGVHDWKSAGKAHPGRWPANVVLDEDAAAELDQQSGVLTSGSLDRSRITAENGIYGAAPTTRAGTYTSNSGGASRFFYTAKASKHERPVVDGVAHPTVKPLSLMRWLVRLVTPPGGIVLDPFAGSGPTLEAALLEGFHAIGVEREAAYLPLIKARLSRIVQLPLDFATGEG